MKLIRKIALFICLGALVVASWIAPLDAPASAQVDAGLKKALVTFASARAASGVISVLQGTQIDVQPAGIGATFAPGQVLAPINELVKHFSDLMLVASISFSIQKILISISSYWVIKLALTLAALGWASFIFWKRPPPPFLSKVLVVILMLRFAVPVAALGSDFLAEQFMQAKYEASQGAINVALGKVAEISLPVPGSPAPVPVPVVPSSSAPAPAATPAPAPVATVKQGIFSGWTKPGWLPLPTMPALQLPKIPHLPNFSEKFEEMKIAAEQTAEHIVTIMGIFFLQTLLLPLLFLWGLLGVAKVLFQLPRLSSGEAKLT